MWAWYWIGVSLGLGTAIGVLCSGLLAPRRALLLAVTIGAAAVGAGVGYALHGWPGAVAGGIGGALGAISAATIIHGALARGGTRGGTALLIVLAALVLAALAFVPVVGYLEALAVLGLAVRARRSQPDRYAGLRSLARD
jgi:hypothetical protein